jgi:hypothetical protein
MFWDQLKEDDFLKASAVDLSISKLFNIDKFNLEL